MLHVFNFKCLMFQIEHRQGVERVFAFNICCIALNASLCSSLEHVLAFKMCSKKNICVQVLHTGSVQYYRTRPRRSISVALLVFKLCSIAEHMFLNTCKRSVPGVQTVFFPINTKVFNIYLLMPDFSGTMLSECCFGKHSSRAIARDHFSRNYCIMTSLKRRCNVFDVILYDKGRNSVEQNAIVHDNSDRSLNCVPRHHCFRVPMWLTNEYPRIYHVMH